MARIGFIGTGQMAQALAGGIATNNENVGFVIADPSSNAIDSFCRKVGERSVEVVENNVDVFALSDIVFLAVKPQYFHAAVVTEEIKVAISNRKTPPLLVSIMAGISIADIQSRANIESVIRVMPNTPCLVGAGASGISCAPSVTESQRDQIMQYLTPTGIVLPVAENLLDAVTGLSGSGPAYIFELMDALALGGVKCGLPRNAADQLAAQTVFGAAKLVIESGEHPSALRDKVTSPGGTTIAGLSALYENGFQHAAISAVESAAKRSNELG